MISSDVLNTGNGSNDDHQYSSAIQAHSSAIEAIVASVRDLNLLSFIFLSVYSIEWSTVG